MLLPQSPLSTTCGIFTKSEDSSQLTLLSPLSTVHAFVTSRIDYCNSILYGLPKSVLKKLHYTKYVQNSSARLIYLSKKFDCRLLLCFSVCTGFSLNRESTSKLSLSPTKLWTERLLNTYPISFHFTVPAEISAHQIRNTSAKPLTTWKPMMPVLSPVLLRHYGTPYRMRSVSPALLILLNGNSKLGSFA